MEPVAWIPSVDFKIAASSPDDSEPNEVVNEELEVNLACEESDQDAVHSNTTCKNVNRSEIDWCDYDEGKDVSVSILNFEWKIERA